MSMRKLLNLIEATAAPRQGATGQKLAQTSGGQFMNRADRTNQTKVNAALGGAVNPATGKPYVAGTAAANQALAKKFSQPAAATSVAAPSADNEALKGQTIAKAMNPPAPAANPGTAAAGIAFNQAAGSNPKTTATSTVPASQSLDAGEEIVSGPANTQTAPYNGAAANAMASKSATPAPAANPGTPAAGIAFNQSGTPAPAPAANPGTPAAGIAFNQSGTPAPAADTRTSDQIATAQLNTPATPSAEPSNLRPGRQLYGYVSEEDAELNELMRLSGRPVNEKAVSKQQQKFMGMVHAMQKGEKIKGASPELKKVAKTMSKKDAKDFASTKHKSLPSKVSESVMLEAGSALEHIINKFKYETKNFLAGDELDSDLYEALFDYYADNGEMPYSVAKARDGDPYQWIDNKFEQDLSIMGHQRDFNAADLSDDRELTELARLAGLTNEDGPGASRLYTRDKSGMGVVPKDTPKDPGMGVAPKDSLKDTGMGVAPKQTSLKDKMSNEGLSDVTDTVIDTVKGVANKGIDAFNDYEQRKKDRWDSMPFGGEPGPGHSGYIPARLPRFQTKADTELADKDKAPSAISTPAASKADAFGAALGAAKAKAETPPADPKRVKEDAELNQMRRIAGLDEARGAPEIGSKLPKSDVETFGLEPGRTYKTNSPKDWKQGDKPRALQQVIPTADKKDHIRSRLGKHVKPAHLPEGAINECGDMGMDQQDSMNVSTNMSSDGTKSVTISAQGDQAAALIDMLRLAGMNSDHVKHDHEPEIVMVSGNKELEESVNFDKVLDAIAALYGDDIWDNDAMQDLANDLEQAGPTDQELDFIIAKGRLPKRLANIQFSAGDSVRFGEEMMDEERVTQYANTPEEEYETIDSIIRQGNDLNREKRQYADKPRLGDNPMAEAFTLDLDLDAMLESILIREEDSAADSAAKRAGDAVKNPSDAAKDVGDKVKGRLSFSKDAEGKTSIKSSTGRIRATIDGNKTQYAPGEPVEKEKTDEGMWDDVSNFVGDVVGTEASKLRQSSQLRDLDALRKQYKGTPYEKQVNDRYDTHLNRLQLDQGDVMDYDPKTGIERLKPVVPPDQWKGGK